MTTAALAVRGRGLPPGSILAAAIVLTAALAIAAVVWFTLRPGPAPAQREAESLAAIAGAPPVPEPMALRAIAPVDAVAANAAIPFSTAPNPAASPVRLALAPEDMARAVDCLAAANYYEAGDDAEGQRSVAQVVVNRLRHPAFPKTVCGVVFQGSERSTGCQFTFTCDGALTRTPSPEAWERARHVARQALSGSVYAPVGNATHYHTDWVVPYWSASLDKIAAVKTHLFFRWKGMWGRPAAFVGAHRGAEPAVARIARLSPAHAAAAEALETAAGTPAGIEIAFAPPEIAAPRPARAPVALSEGEGFVLFLDSATQPGDLPAIAASLCGARDFCKVRGWLNHASAPVRLPIDPFALTTMSFSYVRNQGQRFERAQWNCNQYPREKSRECLKIPFTRAASAAPVKPPAPAEVPVEAPRIVLAGAL